MEFYKDPNIPKNNYAKQKDIDGKCPPGFRHTGENEEVFDPQTGKPIEATDFCIRQEPTQLRVDNQNIFLYVGPEYKVRQYNVIALAQALLRIGKYVDPRSLDEDGKLICLTKHQQELIHERYKLATGLHFPKIC